MRKSLEEFNKDLLYAMIKYYPDLETKENAIARAEKEIKEMYPVYTILKTEVKDLAKSFDSKALRIVFVPYEIDGIKYIGDKVNIPKEEKIITPEELLQGREDKYIELIKNIPKHDSELVHIKADNILCAVLIKEGYNKLVEEYRKIIKYYS